MRQMGLIEVVFRMVIPLWCFLAPIGIFLNVITAPIWLFRKLTGTIKPYTKPKLQVDTYLASTATTKDTLVFLHGWPDSGRLWDKQVDFFKAQGYKCVVFTLPYFDGKGNGWGADFMDIVDEMLVEIRKHKRVTLFAHDWGCMFAYIIAEYYPDLVSRVVSLDIGAETNKNPAFFLGFATYQLFNAFTFLLGGCGGAFLIRCFAKFGKYKCRPITELTPVMCYPYYYMWKRIFTYRDGTPGWRRYKVGPHPVFFGYGDNKNMEFHSRKWAANLEKTKGCKVVSFPTDHWITYYKPDQVNSEVNEWLNSTSSISSAKA